MRKAFTLIELMIVIAIIAIIAAIAIPNLLESRITANEAAAATSLKSGLFPGQVQFQAGGYIDADAAALGGPDGRGTYAAHPAHLAGDITAAGVAPAVGLAPYKALQLVDPKFNNVRGQAGVAGLTAATVAGVATNVASQAGAYDYVFCLNTTAAAIANANGDTAASAEDDAESNWAGVACPKDNTGNEGRRAFGIVSTGSIYQTKGDLPQANTDIATILGGFGGVNQIFARDPRCQVATPNTAPVGGSVPYQK